MDDLIDENLPGSWIQTVASILHGPHRSPMPFTLGEAVDEYGHWARHAQQKAWENRANIESLKLDLDQLFEAIGARLSEMVQIALKELRAVTERTDIADSATRFMKVWQHPDSTIAAFRDLCEAASLPGATGRDLRKLGAILISQLGSGARGNWNILSEVAEALTGASQDMQFSSGLGENKPASEITAEGRLLLAEDLLGTQPPTGEVVVWLFYYRAIVSLRTEVGPITFLRANWAIPKALRDDAFPESSELRTILGNERWSAHIKEASIKIGNNFAIARVSLGRRAVAGAAEEAELRVQAILSIIVGAGGVSWQSTGSAATTLDGQVVTRMRGSNFGLRATDDTYGVGETYKILQHVAEDLGAAMAARSMPEYLIEALRVLREASMTDHRDVSSYGARAVTPRIATALEDHALELIASGSSIEPEDLVGALEEREIDWQFEQQVLGGFLAPFDEPPSLDDLTDRRALEQAICHHEYGTRVVLNAKVVELQHNLLSLRMSRLARAELTDALKIATDTAHEIALHQQIQSEVKMIRLRHRRVRNAINHGNPLTPAALESVRGFGERIAQAALDLALEGYASDTSIETKLATEQVNRQDQLRERAKGRNYFDRGNKE